MSNGSPTTTTDVQVNFYDNYMPSLPAGQYTVTVSQSLTVNTTQTRQDGGNPNVTTPPQPPVAQTFIVRGPRFILDPADVHQVFPPSNASGVYDQYLPMIVFDKRALPWERVLNLSQQENHSPPSDLLAPQFYPWVALLLFADGELLVPQPPSGDAPPPPPPNSQQNPNGTASFALNYVVNATFNGTPTVGPPKGTLGPTITLEADEDPTQIFCNVIEVDAATFVGLVPTLNDMRFLAHVRQVGTANKQPLDTVHDGWFSALIANRFAVPPPVVSPPAQAAPLRNIAHLVTLEGLEPYLGVDTPVTLEVLQQAGFQKVRLISLYSWTFDCLPDPQQNFSQLMLNLISPASEQGTNLLLRSPLPAWAQIAPPAPSALATAFTQLQNGYVPLSYATITGEQTFAWYRGPLAPVVTTRFLETTAPTAAPNPDAPTNATDAMIYDPASGLFDQSYATAFQTGRSLGLANLTFATNLLQWRREAHALVDLLMEYMHSPLLSSVLQSDGILDANGELTATGVSDLAALLQADIASDAFIDFLATDFFNDLAQQIGQAGDFTPQDQAQPTNPPTPQPTVPADLSNLMQTPAVVALLQQLSGLEVSSGSSPPQFDAAIMPKQIIEWLAQTALLYGVPFNNLVPATSMLPDESIRFFYIDQNWIDSLLDGALSVGIQTSRDSLFQQLMRDPLHRATDAALAEVRDKLLGVPTTGGTTAATATPAGFILRSAVVSGWPGLEVRAWSAADSTNPMKPLRLDRVSPTVMIGIFPDVPVKLEFNEPSEGLVFGQEDQGISIRYLPGTSGETTANIGQVINLPVGTTAAALSGSGTTAVTLASPGVPRAVAANTTLDIISPDGNATAAVVTSAAVSQGATQIAILPYDFNQPLPAGSTVQEPLWLTPAQIQQTQRTSTANQPPQMIAGTGGLVAALQNLFPAPQPTLGPAAFAVQMVRVPEQMLFEPENGVSQ